MTSTLKLVAVTVLATAVGLGTFALLATTTPTTPASSPSPEPSPAATPGLLPLSFGELEAGDVHARRSARGPRQPHHADDRDRTRGLGGHPRPHLRQPVPAEPTSPGGAASASRIPSNFFVDPCDTTKGRWDPPLGPTVDDFVEAMADVPGYRSSSRPNRVAGLLGQESRGDRTGVGRRVQGRLRPRLGDAVQRDRGVPRRTASTTGCGSWTSTARGSW